jgi:hypothetical protein
MTRRTLGLLVTLALGLVVAPLAAEAQRVEKVSRIGFLVPGSPATVSIRTLDKRLSRPWQLVTSVILVRAFSQQSNSISRTA